MGLYRRVRRRTQLADIRAPMPGTMRVSHERLRSVLGISSVAVKQGTRPLAITDSQLDEA